MHWTVSILQLLLLCWKSCENFVSLWPLFCFKWACVLRFSVVSAFAVQGKSGNLINIFLYVSSLHYFLWHFFLFLRDSYRPGLQLDGNTDQLYRMKQLEQKKILFDWFGIPWINDHTAPGLSFTNFVYCLAVVSYVMCWLLSIVGVSIFILSLLFLMPPLFLAALLLMEFLLLLASMPLRVETKTPFSIFAKFRPS